MMYWLAFYWSTKDTHATAMILFIANLSVTFTRILPRFLMKHLQLAFLVFLGNKYIISDQMFVLYYVCILATEFNAKYK